MTDQGILDAIAKGAIVVSQGRVAGMNAAAGQYLPHIEIGDTLPAELQALVEDSPRGGEGIIGGKPLLFRRSETEDGWLILLWQTPMEQVQSWQIDGFLYSMRQQMADLMMSLESLCGESQSTNQANRTYYRMMRLVENLEFVRETCPSFRPVTMDLAGFCRHTCAEVAPLLAGCGTTLSLNTSCDTLLMPADPELLKKMLLGLIANGVRAAQDGLVVVTLSRVGNQAKLSVCDDGTLDEASYLEQLLDDHQVVSIPRPGQGAGLGLAVVQRIVQLHGGVVLRSKSATLGGLEVSVGLPINNVNHSARVYSEIVQRDGGLSDLLVALADVLPAVFYCPEDLE